MKFKGKRFELAPFKMAPWCKGHDSMPTQEQLHTIATIIKHQYFTPKMIREMFNAPGGDEELRLIVRDDIAGAGNKIVNALWDL